jgi:signal transduction histidine kinase/CheY-like chemotaxis protein
MVPAGPFGGVDEASPEELRQRLHSLHALIDRAPVPIAIAHDPACLTITGNRALAALLRLPTTANISLTPPPGENPPYRIQRDGRDIPPDELPMQYAIAHRLRVTNEIEIVRADGSVLYVQNDVEPLLDTHGQVYGCVSVVVDLTDRKRAELALIDADRRKDEFLATLSHELRNPLAPIRAAVEIMRLAHGDPQLVEKARATIERQLLHLVRITDDLLDVARITQNRVELRRERLDLRAVIDAALEACRPMIDAQGLVLTLEIPPQPLWIVADFTRLAQAFSNLLNNAAKYTEPGGQIRVSMDASDGVAIVTVADTGLGIEPPLLQRIFDMFTQLQAHRERAQGGLGIGLTLARRLIELHGGTIEAFSEGAGRGSRFTVRLSTAPEVIGAADAAALPDPADDSQPCRVLIAEDNADAAEMMQLMLSFKGHDVRVAQDGIEAIAVAAQFQPQIAFVDIGMPRLDGYGAARGIRERLGAGVVLVAVTGWGQDEDKQRSREAGFDHHITKPPEPDALERLIASCTRK